MKHANALVATDAHIVGVALTDESRAIKMIRDREGLGLAAARKRLGELRAANPDAPAIEPAGEPLPEELIRPANLPAAGAAGRRGLALAPPPEEPPAPITLEAWLVERFGPAFDINVGGPKLKAEVEQVRAMTGEDDAQCMAAVARCASVEVLVIAVAWEARRASPRLALVQALNGRVDELAKLGDPVVADAGGEPNPAPAPAAINADSQGDGPRRRWLGAFRCKYTVKLDAAEMAAKGIELATLVSAEKPAMLARHASMKRQIAEESKLMEAKAQSLAQAIQDGHEPVTGVVDRWAEGGDAVAIERVGGRVVKRRPLLDSERMLAVSGPTAAPADASIIDEDDGDESDDEGDY